MELGVLFSFRVGYFFYIVFVGSGFVGVRLDYLEVDFR